MAKIVYDPTVDRQAKKGVKVFSAAPKEGEKPKKIEYDPKAAPRGKATVKRETKEEKPAEPKPVTKPTDKGCKTLQGVLTRMASR